MFFFTMSTSRILLNCMGAAASVQLRTPTEMGLLSYTTAPYVTTFILNAELNCVLPMACLTDNIVIFFH